MFLGLATPPAKIPLVMLEVRGKIVNSMKSNRTEKLKFKHNYEVCGEQIIYYLKANTAVGV